LGKVTGVVTMKETGGTGDQVIKRLTFKPGRKREWRRWIDHFIKMEQHLQDGTMSDGRPYIVVIFDNGLDYLAFLAASGLVSLEPVGPDEAAMLTGVTKES